ncbi:DEAD/DEAH box helicase [Flaviaesturariibacter flavus]|uniref:DEAD/DEAH box helicase n=1 Tax=Flaviaesturariibacter flavus TaxID=2502780 RepID=A0A4R1BMN5_9BACT|nr:DEAD/DEAH box helicase [Flaviaesturariibacter flavus]TCJ18675.1 DEAD/DEAH box helicase [Flaviaesturariibacter flavus]
MLPIKDLQELLLHAETPRLPATTAAGERIIVLRHYRFHKKLSIELYEAPLTKEGKLKNPLTPIDPLEAVLQATDPDELRFYAAVSRFQNNSTALAGPADLEALHVVWHNPLRWSFWWHDPEFSEKVVAGSLRPVSKGGVLHDLTLLVTKEEGFYDLRPSLEIGGVVTIMTSVDLQYQYFVRRGESWYLPANFHLLKAVRFFGQYPSGMRLRPADFEQFRRDLLVKLEERITVVYAFARTLAADDARDTGLYTVPERLIYLSALGPYVLITPVMKYGVTEVPVRSRRSVYAPDAKGGLLQLQRDSSAERDFTALLLRQHPHFVEQVDGDLPYFYLHRKRFLDEHWFLDAVAQWQAEGIAVLGFSELKGNKLNAARPQLSVQVRSGINWFNAIIGLRYGRQKAGLQALRRAVRNKERYVALGDGSLGVLPEEWIERFASWFGAAEATGEELRLPKTAFKTVRELFRDEELDEATRHEVSFFESTLLRSGAVPPTPVPAALHADLRHYQKEGFDWLAFLDNQNFGGCLADDMGLGKTVQAIALLLLQKELGRSGPSLVVMPTSLLFNWKEECARFAPGLQVVVLHGTGRAGVLRRLGDYDLVLTTYGTLLSDSQWLQQQEFNLLLLDEAQNIKNPSSLRYEMVSRIRARNRFTLTGTPFENRSLDLYAQLSIACPGLLGTPRAFRALFSIPIDQFKDSRRAADLQQRIAPFVLRRTKEQVAAELPERTEMVLHCPMGEAQRRQYDACAAEFKAWLEGMPSEELENHPMHVLRGLTKLRLICNSPLLSGDEDVEGDASSKIAQLLDHLENSAAGHKVLVFSQFVSMLALIRKEFDARGIGYSWLTGATRDREGAVRRFRGEPGVQVFLVSLKAGGTGLNLTEADYVYLVDPWWNPAVEQQAIDRAHRIGQTKKVVALRLICPDTIEEKMMKLQEEKRALGSQLVKSDSAFMPSFTREEWLRLLA